jgi:catechol 2,3-dioxygenase-like lactoylglutathione lyase family enzyme
LRKAGGVTGDVVEVDGRLTLPFEDGEGQRLVLADDGGTGSASPWQGSPVPAERQIRGLGPIVLNVQDISRTEKVLTGVMNMRRERDYAAPDAAARVHVFAMGEGGPAAELHVIEQRDLPVARQGAGGVHHVAFRTPDTTQYQAWAQCLNELGIRNSGEIDRFYFRSLYFREPNGILFEIATDGPGFATRRADGNARRKTGAAAVPGAAPRADRGRAEAAGLEAGYSGMRLDSRMRLGSAIADLRRIPGMTAFKLRAFSSEVGTGSREENASKQKTRAPFRFHRNGKGSRSTGYSADFRPLMPSL